jgi:hypothetical protein
MHYIAVYQSWPHHGLFGEIQVLKALLSIQPLPDESNLGSASFADSIVPSYEMYDDSMIEDNNNGLNSIVLVSVFTLDNCIVNKAAVGILSKPMIGAHCHHLNLAATH